MTRDIIVEKIQTKSASRKIDLQCAEFELGSAQFDMPVMNFKNEQDFNSMTPQLAQSSPIKKGLGYSPDPVKERMHKAGDSSARKKVTLENARTSVDCDLFEEENTIGPTNALRVLT